MRGNNTKTAGDKMNNLPSNNGNSQASRLHLAGMVQARKDGEAAMAVIDNVGVGVTLAVNSVDDALAGVGAVLVADGDVNESAAAANVNHHHDEGEERLARDAA